MTDFLLAYWRMCQQWQSIVVQPLPDENKQRACLAVLREHMGRRAMTRFGEANPSLRFYADMIVLKELLLPGPGSLDDFGRLALQPSYKLIHDWVATNSEPR